MRLIVVPKAHYGGMMEEVDILGVKISKVDYQSAMGKIKHFLVDGGKHYIVTSNPEFVVLAQFDHEFRQILNRADLAVPDGVGLRMAAKFFSMSVFNFTIVKLIQTIFQGLFVGAAGVFKPSFLDTLPWAVTGTGLMIKLCGLAAEKGYSVFLLGGRDGVAEGAAKRLKVQFANLNIVGTCEGDPGEGFDEEIRQKLETGSSKLERKLEARSWKRAARHSVSSVQHPTSSQASSFKLQASSIDLLFVAYGAPKQEKWIAENLDKIPVKVAMGVGGAFDFIAGKKRRAPLALRRLGLEWLWRLIQEPLRLPRILNATIKFPLLVFIYKLKRKAPVETGD